MSAKQRLSLRCSLLALAVLAAGSLAATSAPFAEIQELVASDAGIGDHFGVSLALEGDTALIGAHLDDHSGLLDAGSVYLFERSAGRFEETTKLMAGDAAAGDHFGVSLALEGDTLVVGATGHDSSGPSSGAAYVFERSAAGWVETARLMASDGAAGDGFGRWIAIDGDTIAVTSAGDDHSGHSNAGSAYVFVRHGSSWTEQQKITPADPASQGRFGRGIALAGDELLVSASLKNTEYGSIYVFERLAGAWNQQDKLFASDRARFDEFGGRLALEGDTLVASAAEDDHSGFHDPGSAYVLVRQAGGWAESQKLIAADLWHEAWLGGGLGLDQGTLVITGSSARSASHTGAAWVFRESGGTWSEAQRLVGSDVAVGDRFGAHYAALDGDTFLVGAWFHDHLGVEDSGSVYVFSSEVAAPPEPECGDGSLDLGESCDDGNLNDGDGCRSDCTLEVCGDGVLDLGESCDDGNPVGGDGCRPDCTLESCGDGILDPGESCDDGNPVGGDGCRPDCTAELCGDGVLDAAESCDDGNADLGDGCRPDCTVEECGDGIVDPSESCDDGDGVDYDECRNDCSAPRVGHVRPALAAVPGLDDSEMERLALLEPGSLELAIFDPSTGEPLARHAISARHSIRAVALRVLPDGNGNGAAEVAVLATLAGGRGIVWVHDSATGRRLRRLKLPVGFEPIDLEVVADLDSAGSGLAVLGRAVGEGPAVIWFGSIRRSPVARLDFPGDLTPIDLEITELESGDGFAAVLLARDEADGGVHLVARELSTDRRLAAWRFEEVFFPLDLEVLSTVPDAVAVLGEALDGGSRVWWRRLVSGESIKTTRLARAYQALRLEPVGQAGRSGRAGMAVVQRPVESGRLRIDTRSAAGRRRLGVVSFRGLHTQVGLAVLDAAPADHFAVVGEARCADGSRAIVVRDASGGRLVGCHALD